MTVIAIKKTENEIVISSDSQASFGDAYKMTDTNKKTIDIEKIFEINDMVIGVSGSVKGKSYLKIFCKTHKPKDATTDDILDFILEFKEFMKNSKVGIFNYIKYVRNIKRKNYYNICNVIVKISPKNTRPGFINNEFAFFDHYDSNIVSIYKKLMQYEKNN